MFSDRLLAKVDEVSPEGVSHVGFVMSERDGAVTVLEPASPPPGVPFTLPRVKRLTGEPASRAVVRCVSETFGVHPESLFPVPVIWSTPDSTTVYFAGFTPEPRPVVGRLVGWHPTDEAAALLARATYAPTRNRNLGVLAAVRRMCLSPYRRVLEMVGELHRLGYERLRAPAYMYPLAWRCPVVPATWTLREHGGLFREHGMMGQSATDEGPYTYSSAGRQETLFQNFPMRGLEFASPRELAEGFLRLRPRLAFAGWGPDPEYAAWLRTTLEILTPHGMYYAFGEFQEPRDTVYASHSRVEQVRLPPPGYSTGAEWDEFVGRHPDV